MPRGRHGLTREQVVASQRERMVRAMAEAMVDKGFAGTSVAEIIRRAGVSRETFYEQFASKGDCFAAAYDTVVGLLLQAIGGLLAVEEADSAAGPTTPKPHERFDRALATYLDLLASEPAYARLFLIEVYAAGPVAIQRRVELQARFVDAIADVLGVTSAEDRIACEALVAAISSMATARLAVDDLDGLRALREPLVALVRRFGRLTA